MLRIIARRTQVKPPVVLEGCRVEQFAIRDRSMRFEGHAALRCPLKRSRFERRIRKRSGGQTKSGEVLLRHLKSLGAHRLHEGAGGSVSEPNPWTQEVLSVLEVSV
jgi:hypothetical protein